MKKDHLYNGSVYDIEFYYTVEWSSGTGEYASVMTKSYTVYMPEEYDGLTFMAIPQADHYKDNEKMGFMGDIYPGALLLDIDLVDAYNCLLFRI